MSLECNHLLACGDLHRLKPLKQLNLSGNLLPQLQQVAKLQQLPLLQRLQLNDNPLTQLPKYVHIANNSHTLLSLSISPATVTTPAALTMLTLYACYLVSLTTCSTILVLTTKLVFCSICVLSSTRSVWLPAFVVGSFRVTLARCFVGREPPLTLDGKPFTARELDQAIKVDVPVFPHARQRTMSEPPVGALRILWGFLCEIPLCFLCGSV